MSGDDQPIADSAASVATATRPAAATADQPVLRQREMTEFGPSAPKRARGNATGDGAVSEAPSAPLHHCHHRRRYTSPPSPFLSPPQLRLDDQHSNDPPS